MKPYFLFGSGADSCACSKLNSGQSFSSDIIKNKFHKEINCITGFDASQFQLLHPNSTKIFVQTIVSNEAESRRVFGDILVNDFVNYYNGIEDIDYKEKISKICKEFYNVLLNERDDSLEKKFFLKNAVFFDTIDEKFNSLRDINYNKHAKKVINTYLTVFLIMFKKLYDKLPADFNWTYENIYEKLNNDYDVELSEVNYYNLLAKHIPDCNVATTNYTEIISNEMKRSDVVYLHGKLTWFEDLENLMVYDCTDTIDCQVLKSAKHIIPFILIPSGVKPLICKRQIKMFDKFIDDLDNSKFLIVVGYKFNSEDNHINSIIAEWLRDKENKIIYFNYNNSVAFDELNWAKNFSICTKKYDECKRIVSEQKITDVIVNKNNSLLAFENLLSELNSKN